MPTYKNVSHVAISNIENVKGIPFKVLPGKEVKTKQIYNIKGLLEISPLPYYTPNLGKTLITSPSEGTLIEIDFNYNADKWTLINNSNSIITVYYNHTNYEGYGVLPGFNSNDDNLKDMDIEKIYLEIDGEVKSGEAIFHQLR